MIYLVIWFHFIADFLLQTDKMALNKSTSMKWLSSHIMAYSAPMLLLGWKFALINGLAHFATDFVTSKITSRLWAKGDRHGFFAVIGADQALHATVLIATIPLINPVWNWLT